MDQHKFRTTLDGGLPADLTPYLQVLWHDGASDWDRAHDIAQDLHDANGYWLHAYLHRKEGDLPNADYWYRRAAKPRPTTNLEEEWNTLVQHFLTDASA